MARLELLDDTSRARLLALDCPVFATQPWVQGPPLKQQRVALISTAGLHRRGDRPFGVPSGHGPAVQGDYRVIPSDLATNDLVMSHVSVNFDRTGFQQDWNVIFPLERLHELAQQGIIGSVAAFHYSFMGATDPRQMEPAARELAQLLQQDHVNAALLIPV